MNKGTHPNRVGTRHVLMHLCYIGSGKDGGVITKRRSISIDIDNHLYN